MTSQMTETFFRSDQIRTQRKILRFPNCSINFDMQPSSTHNQQGFEGAIKISYHLSKKFSFPVAKATLQSQMYVPLSICPLPKPLSLSELIIQHHHPPSFIFHPLSFLDISCATLLICLILFGLNSADKKYYGILQQFVVLMRCYLFLVRALRESMNQKLCKSIQYNHYLAKFALVTQVSLSKG